jgi:hypothetical protein
LDKYFVVYIVSEKLLKTIKGKIKKINRNRNQLKINGVESFELAFNINDIDIEMVTEISIDAKEGDYVIVAGEDNLKGIFKAYSFKNLN